MNIKSLRNIIDGNTSNIIAEYAQDILLDCIQCKNRYKLSCYDQWIKQSFSNKYTSSNYDQFINKLYFCKKNQIYILETIELKQNVSKLNKYEILCYKCRDSCKGRRQCIICGELFRWRITTNQDDIDHHITTCYDCVGLSFEYNCPNNCSVEYPCLACYVSSLNEYCVIL